MSKLLRAGYARLFRDKVFWAALAVLFAAGCWAAHTKWSDKQMGFTADPASALLAFIVLVPLAMAAVTAMYTGAEFDCGALRNKLAVGHLRRDVYLAQLQFSIAAGVLASLAYLVPYTLLCLVLVGPTSLPMGQLVTHLGLALCTLLAYAALYTLVTMRTGKRATAAVACLLLFMALLAAGLVVKNMLDAPEFISNYSFTINGLEQGTPEPNPKYLQPAARAFWSFVLDLLPGGQCIQLSEVAAASPLRMVLCSLGEALAFTLAGLALFQKRDLK